MKNTLYNQAATHSNSDRPPIWMMRQAGRFLPEYREIRQNHSFLDMMKNPDLATEITLQPIRRFGMDAAIMFSDILVTAEALGSDLDFVEKKGPVIANPIRSMDDIKNLPDVDMKTHAHYVYKTLNNLSSELKNTSTALLGFCGAPFTVASYMIEGGSSPDLRTVKTMMGHEPEILHALLNKLADISIDYLHLQIEAGAEGVQIFDTWAGHLSYLDFQSFSLPYIKKIVDGIKAKHSTPISVYSRYSSNFGPLFETLNIDVLSVDWQCDMAQMRQSLRPDLALQGNLDPLLLLGSRDTIKTRTLAILDSMKGDPGFIFNLGHGVIPQIDPDNVKLVVDLVQSYT